MNSTNLTLNATPNGTMPAPLPSLAQRVISAIAISALIILSISGNALVIASFYFYKKIRRSVTNCFIVSLAVSDLMVAFLSEPFWLSYEIDHWNSLPKNWNAKTFSMFWVILDITCAVASIVNLMFISIDRYFAIKSPLSHHTKMTPETSIWIILALWIYSIGAGCLFLLGWYWKFLMIFIIGFLVPLIIMVFCYVGIMVVISSKARLSNQVGTTRLDKEFKTAKSLGVVTGSFVLCWLPFFMLSLVYRYCIPCVGDIERLPALTSAVKWLHYLNSCLNPIIYAFLNPTFKVAFRSLFRKFCTNPNNFHDDMTVSASFFQSANIKRNRSTSHRNGQVGNGVLKSKGKKGFFFRRKHTLDESLQDSSSENVNKKVNENTYIEKADVLTPCATESNIKEPLCYSPRDSQPPTEDNARQERHVHYADDFKPIETVPRPLENVDCNSILSDSNNSENSEKESKETKDPSPNGYRLLSKRKNSTDELDHHLSTLTDTTEICTYHDQESDQFYFYVDGELIADKDIKTSNV
ncbi:histamine H2 receptor-like [Actinia tenebrosa]|uniref:Histamine H2 receptor-like n=1 Tax=Actinia tenebrosa TaxID=6105 RepID=A0A6P8IRF7_ACTTE|nr:histamine H2 receptor-like [Actinia tenebrosa]XP_031563756.1 histamine H2 receptor-like [Actinia tenebrosa]XP_031564479.1 histamine H2 receptor-like [Actinia tenebrosa]XP_031565234.1 histamine H2 receptor-like [Actinia tenebrosa]XP_031565976.1 histamine H2 receptor-like [Actinia tenebrosa]XP_031566711.1 histamine H2 receptor-like [Actinia tenebrosa]XP_031567466.1 histamine H2 receptor-like [Actinia tenebrosa]XP_031568215.1 histamine H2 receptor-like [Actinia tenebrosa]XP_031568960.1 hist